MIAGNVLAKQKPRVTTAAEQQQRQHSALICCWLGSEEAHQACKHVLHTLQLD